MGGGTQGMVCIEVNDIAIGKAFLNAVVELIPITCGVFEMQLIVRQLLVVLWAAVAIDKYDVILTHGRCIEEDK